MPNPLWLHLPALSYPAPYRPGMGSPEPGPTRLAGTTQRTLPPAGAAPRGVFSGRVPTSTPERAAAGVAPQYPCGFRHSLLPAGRPAGPLQLGHRGRPRPAAGPAPGAAPGGLALVRLTLWTGRPPFSRSQPPSPICKTPAPGPGPAPGVPLLHRLSTTGTTTALAWLLSPQVVQSRAQELAAELLEQPGEADSNKPRACSRI